MRSKKIKVFYDPKQVLSTGAMRNFSKSPLKPKLLLEHLSQYRLDQHLEMVSKFRPFNAYDFQIAHESNYIKEFFTGGKRSTSNGLEWTPQFADSVRYTNASLWEAIQNSLVNPHEVSFSPTSGFHHAQPKRGSGYCTFSGQVIASVKAYRKYGAVGCYIDLDGHFGNSIEDSRTFQPDLNKAVPIGFNFNPRTYGESYYEELTDFILNRLTPAIMLGKIDYVVWCHGADSHKWDQLGHQVDTNQWVRCATFFWSWVKETDALLGRPISVACALFGGYRADDYNSVLSLHASDLRECMNRLLGLNVTYETDVKEPPRFDDYFLTGRRAYGRSDYICSTDRGARIRNKKESDRVMLEQQRRRNEIEEAFEDYYAERERRRGFTP